MLRYVGDAYRSSTTGQDEAGWKREWELVDDSDSENSPRQHNGHDCRIFVITNITLLAQKIPLKEQTYTEATFLEQNTRECIALLLWSASQNVSAHVRLHNKDKGSDAGDCSSMYRPRVRLNDRNTSKIQLHSLNLISQEGNLCLCERHQITCLRYFGLNREHLYYSVGHKFIGCAFFTSCVPIKAKIDQFGEEISISESVKIEAV